MMDIDEAQVKKIAGLARLSLTRDELSLYQGQLVKILHSMEELSRVDTTDVPPTSSVSGVENVMREDEVEAFPDTESILDGAPEREGSYYKVRKVIE